MGNQTFGAGLNRVGDATVTESLLQATASLADRGVPTPRLDAEVLLAAALGWRREDLYACGSAPLFGMARDRFWAYICRRKRSEPVSYITGRKEFWSLDFLVTPDVLIPRPETESLVEAALGFAAGREERGRKRILDVGTGSGAIAVSLAKERADAEIWATDLSKKALAVARLNAKAHGVRERIRFRRGDLFGPIAGMRGRFDVIVANPPYLRRGDIETLAPEVREWEPDLALDGGEDGLDFYRRIAAQAWFYLSQNGRVVVEVGAGMGDKIRELFVAADRYLDVSVLRDYSGLDRVVTAGRKGS
jgi:release factor glutamine methyltransferase